MYKFFIDSVQINPVYGDNFAIVESEQSDNAFYRKRLSGSIKLQRKDGYETVLAANIDHEFEFKIEEEVSGVWTEVFVGVFTKVDCQFDENERYIEVQPEPRDQYREVLGSMDKEYDVIRLAPDRDTVTYKKQPLLQLYFIGDNFITNVLSGTYWELEVTAPIYDSNELINTYKFGKGPTKYFIPGSGLSPDVSGEYNEDIERLDGHYDIVEESVGQSTQWVVRDLFDSRNIVYRAPLDEPLFNTLFTSETDPTSQFYIFQGPLYGRILTDESTIGGNTTHTLPQDDIVGDLIYKRVLDVEVTSYFPSSANQDDSTRYGRFDDAALHFSGKYFAYPTFSSQLYPITRTGWESLSWWFYYDTALRTLQEDGSQDIVLKDAYKLSAVISTLLAEIDPTLTFAADTAHSEFLYATTNPVSSQANPIRLITPKSNVLVGEYDQPASKGILKLSDVLTLLWSAYRCRWYIDSSNRFRVEHISWFENGGSYATAITGADLTTLTDRRTRRNWGYFNDKYSYQKSEMPERITVKWMDDTSEPFVGYPIEILSNFVQRGNIKEERIGVFTSDVDYILSQPTDVAQEGFAIFAAQDVGGVLEVPFVEFEPTPGFEWNMQNGWLSNIWLQDKYHRHALPAEDVKINEETTTATSVQRRKQQSNVFPRNANFDAMALIVTSLGAGKVVSKTLTLETNQLTIVSRHETT